MRAIIGAVLVLAGSVLVSAGIVAHDLGKLAGGHAGAGYFLGGFLMLVGVIVLVSGPLKSGWDAIPVDGKKTKAD